MRTEPAPIVVTHFGVAESAAEFEIFGRRKCGRLPLWLRHIVKGVEENLPVAGRRARFFFQDAPDGDAFAELKGVLGGKARWVVLQVRSPLNRPSGIVRMRRSHRKPELWTNQRWQRHRHLA